jgi:hypothetical protein
MHLLLRGVMVGALLGTASCEHTGNGPSTDYGVVTNGTFEATIDGTAWHASGRVIVSEPAGASLVLDASSPTYVMRLTMTPLLGVGAATFSLAAGPTNGSAASLTLGASKWSTANANGTGIVNLSALSSSRATGTFTFEAPPTPGSGSTATAHVSGKFDVSF